MTETEMRNLMDQVIYQMKKVTILPRTLFLEDFKKAVAFLALESAQTRLSLDSPPAIPQSHLKIQSDLMEKGATEDQIRSTLFIVVSEEEIGGPNFLTPLADLARGGRILNEKQNFPFYEVL